MNGANLVYNYEKILAGELLNIKHGQFNAEILLKYYRSRVADGLSLARIIKCLNTLKLVSKSLAKPFMEATKDVIVSFIAKLEERDISEWTKRDYKTVLKCFYKCRSSSSSLIIL